MNIIDKILFYFWPPYVDEEILFKISKRKKQIQNQEEIVMASPDGKKKKEKKVAVVMKEGYAGKLHSGSKKGHVVSNPAQMKAIGMSEAGVSNKKKGSK